MTVSSAVIQWLKEFDLEDYWKMQKINTEVMHSDVDYVLIKAPIKNEKTFISGTKIITEQYQLGARLDSICDKDSVDNTVWLEALETWIEKRNLEKNFPVLSAGTVQEIGIATSFFKGHDTGKKAIYQLTIYIKYKKGAES
ncbi:MAG: hypothetical protein J6M66_09800 [Lachnospiraceae bacterium]|nr:hypothetical protein [Lachnospiraceae bacterium]